MSNTLRIEDILAPLIVYSFSSRGFPDLLERVRQTLPSLGSAYLFSLFDTFHIPELLSLIPPDDQRIRIWDSGGYETRHSDDVSAIISAAPSIKLWNMELYVQAANEIRWNGKDILVSFDRLYDLPVREQLELAFDGYKQIKGNYVKDVLLHVDANTDIDNLVQTLLPYLSDIDILGFTEKEIAPTWIQGVHFIRALKTAFTRLAINPPPIHLFGCLDPKSIIYFALAGVSIFDGLSWLRFYFRGRDTLYKREFEYLADPNNAVQGISIEYAITLENIRLIDALSSDLTYHLSVSDNNKFDKEQRKLKDIYRGG